MTASQRHEQDERTIPTRRQMLRATGGGLVLAASGLFLPGWLEDAEAREGALDGAKGGRRGRDHRGRRKHRDHGEKKDKNKDRNEDKPRGNIFQGDLIKFRIGVAGFRPVKVAEFYRYIWRGTIYLKLKETKTLEPGDVSTFEGSYDSALWFNDRYWVEAESLLGIGSPANVTLGHGGSITANPIEWQGGTTVFDEQMDAGQLLPAIMDIDGFYIRVQRLANEDYSRFIDWNVFEVSIAAPA